MEQIEEAFQKTTEVVLGKKLEGIENYEHWLTRHVNGTVRKIKSAMSDKTVYSPSLEFFKRMERNIVTLDESLELGNQSLSLQEVNSFALKNANAVLSQIKTTTPEIIYGKNIGSEECACYGPTKYCYKSTFCWFSDYIAYSFWPRDSEYLFGCSNVAGGSKYSLKCYSSTKLVRCFEVNDSNSCSDCYFCHNCENLRECMFCFNTKGKRYAIGNVEVGREAYMKVKKLVLAEITKELSETKGFRHDIYSIGSQKSA